VAVTNEAFQVRFANGQGNGTFSSLVEARRIVARRAGYDPPPPGIFPAEIWRLVSRGDASGWEFVERVSGD
jgi:hypothetical protein